MDQLDSILSMRDYDEPPEVAALKDYVRKNFASSASVSVHPDRFVLSVKSASLAGTLRMHMPDIKRECKLDRKLVIRISG